MNPVHPLFFVYATHHYMTIYTKKKLDLEFLFYLALNQ